MSPHAAHGGGGGLIIALSFIFGMEAFKEEGTLAAALMKIGGGSAFALMIPVLAGYIAYSIADRPSGARHDRRYAGKLARRRFPLAASSAASSLVTAPSS